MKHTELRVVQDPLLLFQRGPGDEQTLASFLPPNQGEDEDEGEENVSKRSYDYGGLVLPDSIPNSVATTELDSIL